MFLPIKSPKLIDKTLIEIMLRPDLQISKFLSDDKSDYNLRTMLQSYYQEVAYMIDDVYFQRTLLTIQANEKANKIWNEILKNQNNNLGISTNEDRKIYFKIAGIKICLNFTNQLLHKYYRYKFVEYIPNNKLIALLNRIL